MSPLPSAFLSFPLAHRGLHDRARRRIENSPSAFEAAIAVGYGIELDLQLSGDGRAMVFHDGALDRLTGATGPVAERTAAALSRIRLTGSDETIPTFAATLAQVAGRVPLLVELKDQTGTLGETDGRLEAAVAADLGGYSGPVALMSFNPSMIAAVARLAQDVPRGLTTDAFAETAWAGVPAARLAALRRLDLATARASFVSHDRRDLAAPRIAALKARGVPILTWTIRSPEQEAEARRTADNITFEGYRPSAPPASA